MNTTARVRLWGRDIGAVTWLDERELAVFQFTPAFAGSGIQVAPLTMSLQEAPYEFPALSRETFHGLPGLLADSLPDKFGNKLIDAWLATQGRSPGSLNPVERLCYTGSRGMGALEFKPTINGAPSKAHKIKIEALVDLANRVLDERISLEGKFAGQTINAPLKTFYGSAHPPAAPGRKRSLPGILTLMSSVPAKLRPRRDSANG